MLKIFNFNKTAQSFLDELQDVDWFSDELEDEYPPRYSQQQKINENNYADYLADDIENAENNKDDNMPSTDNEFNYSVFDNEQGPSSEYDDPYQLINDGMDYNRIISFDYVTRNGNYIGTRVVEPHYVFVANSTGNTILVSYDRNVNDIRAFIISQRNMPMGGKLYTDVEFRPRQELFLGI